MGLRLSLKKLGIDPDRDVKIVRAGGNPERLAAISKGMSQFTIMNEPFIKEAERLGFRDLVDMAIKTDKEATKAIIAKYTRLKDPERLERTYRNYTSVLMDVPYPHPAGIKTLLDHMAPKNPKAAAAEPKSFVDPRFIQELEVSGFFKQLHKP